MVALNAQVKQRAAQAAAALASRAPLRAAYLFGSQVEGHADEWSDIDVAGFVDGLESWDLDRETKLILQVQKEVGFDIEPHLFPASALTHPEPGSFAQYVLEHGVRVE